VKFPTGGTVRELEGNDASIRESDLRSFFRYGEGEKTQEYFVYFKFLRQRRGEKRAQSAEVV